jgi:magnesium-transporting ATPase (P-type)
MNRADIAILINGASLALILEDSELHELILDIFELGKSIIIFRSSPSEKA